RNWLAVWHGDRAASRTWWTLDRAERVLQADPVKAAAGAGRTDVVGDEELRRTARSVEAAAAHLEHFATLVRLALVCGRPRPRARPWRCCIQLALPVALLQFSQVAGHRLAVGPHRQLAWLPDFFTRPKYLFHYIFRPCLFMSCLHRVMINIFPTIYSYYNFFYFLYSYSKLYVILLFFWNILF